MMNVRKILDTTDENPIAKYGTAFAAPGFYFPAVLVEASQPPILPSYRSRTSTMGEVQSFGTVSLAFTVASFWLNYPSG